MISKSMYKVLKHIPQSPNKITLIDLSKEKICDVSFLKKRLLEAMSSEYIRFCNYKLPSKGIDLEPFYLTEAGRVEVEAYENQRGSSTKATWALIIAGLSLLVSAVAVVISLVQ